MQLESVQVVLLLMEGGNLHQLQELPENKIKYNYKIVSFYYMYSTFLKQIYVRFVSSFPIPKTKIMNFGLFNSLKIENNCNCSLSF